MESLNVEQEQRLAWAKEQFETGQFDGLDSHDIGRQLREAGLDQDTRKTFARWFIQRGLDEGWLGAEMGLH